MAPPLRDAAGRAPAKSRRAVRAPALVRASRPYWGLLAVVVLLLASAAFATDPLRDAVTGATIPEASMRRSIGYVLLAPVSDVLDLITLLSVRQHVTVLLTLALGYAIWWWARGHRIPATVRPGRRAARIAARIGLALLSVVALYAAAILLPRPMASLETAPSVIAVDFHSHTNYSYDARPDWTVEDNRKWHRDAGFGAAFVTDHRTFDGAHDAWANNPAIVGEDVALLPGIEVSWKGEHVNVLDADRKYRGILTSTLRDIDDDALTLASAIRGNEPVIIETLPGDLSKMIPANGPGTAGVRAVEIVDGAPRGLGQTRRERARIVHLADSLDLALVAGSDHHGWGHTATAWTLLFVPQWRSASPAQLTDAIATILRRGARQSTRVVERYVVDTETGVRLPFTLPLVVWGMLRTLSTDERVSWVLWAVALTIGLRLLRSSRPSTAEDDAV